MVGMLPQLMFVVAVEVQVQLALTVVLAAALVAFQTAAQEEMVLHPQFLE